MFDFFKKIYETLGDYNFWLKLFDAFAAFGPYPPILLAYVEAFFPMLPLVAIVALNVAGHGIIKGFLFSWIGSLLGAISVFSIFRYLRNKPLILKFVKMKNVDRLLSWVKKQNVIFLFLLTIFPFTPSFLINISFGLADFKVKEFVFTIFFSKALMIASLALFGSSLITSFTQPVYFIISAAIIALLYGLSIIINRISGLDDVNK
jgi:uncharacterized membrane protein YdjX (TVP38/TMEM64 family)